MIDDATLAEKIKLLHPSWHGERGPCSFEGCETEPCPTLRGFIAEIRRLREFREEADKYHQKLCAEIEQTKGLTRDLAAHQAVVRELAQLLTNACTMRQTGGLVGDNIDRWLTSVILALAHPLVQQARGAEVIIKPAHVCGAWGYGQPGDSCPACDSVRRVQ